MTYLTGVLLVEQLVENSREVSQGDKCTRSEDEGQGTIVLRHNAKSEDGTCAKEFAASTKNRQSDGKSETDTDTVACRVDDTILAGKRLSTTQHDTVPAITTI